MGRYEVADQCKNSHNNVLGYGYDIGSRHFSYSDASVGLVGSVQVDVVGADTGCDSELELLGLGKALCGKIAGVETAE